MSRLAESHAQNYRQIARSLDRTKDGLAHAALRDFALEVFLSVYPKDGSVPAGVPCLDDKVIVQRVINALSDLSDSLP